MFFPNKNWTIYSGKIRHGNFTWPPNRVFFKSLNITHKQNLYKFKLKCWEYVFFLGFFANYKSYGTTACSGIFYSTKKNKHKICFFHTQKKLNNFCIPTFLHFTFLGATGDTIYSKIYNFVERHKISTEMQDIAVCVCFFKQLQIN